MFDLKVLNSFEVISENQIQKTQNGSKIYVITAH